MENLCFFSSICWHFCIVTMYWLYFWEVSSSKRIYFVNVSNIRKPFLLSLRQAQKTIYIFHDLTGVLFSWHKLKLGTRKPENSKAYNWGVYTGIAAYCLWFLLTLFNYFMRNYLLNPRYQVSSIISKPLSFDLVIWNYLLDFTPKLFWVIHFLPMT